MQDKEQVRSIINDNLEKIKSLLNQCAELADQQGIIFSFEGPANSTSMHNDGALKYLPQKPLTHEWWAESSKSCGHTLEGPGMWISNFGDGFNTVCEDM